MHNASEVILWIIYTMLLLATIIMSIVGFFLIRVALKIRRKVRQVERLISASSAMEFGSPDILKPRDAYRLTKDELAFVKGEMLRKKEQEARDHDTIDKATEYNRDI